MILSPQTHTLTERLPHDEAPYFPPDASTCLWRDERKEGKRVTG